MPFPRGWTPGATQSVSVAELLWPRATTAKAQRAPGVLALALMLASGFAGLGYQIVWTQQCTLWLGHESAAVLAVVTAFFGGLALGALALGPRIDRSARPERWYAACEATIAVWSLALALLLAPVSQGLLALTGAAPTPLWQGLVAFAGTFFVLLPATAAMGATLPAMQRITQRWAAEGVARLYAANTLGAVLGVLATAFWLIPAVGLARTAAVCAGLNALCALTALRWANPGALPQPVAQAPRQDSLMVLAATGLLGIAYEVLVVRVLSQVAEDTVYTFALLLALYLVGSAAGASAYARWGAHAADLPLLRRRLLGLQGASCLLGALSLWGAEAVKQWLRSSLGSSMASALAAEATLALLAFGAPTVVMGALFCHLSRQAQAAGHSLGKVLGINTLGAAAAPLLFGVLLVPVFGAKASLLLAVAGYLVLMGLRGGATPWFWGPAGAVLALAAWAPPLAFIDVPEGGRVLSYAEGAMAAVSVVEDGDGVARLRINNRQQEGSSATVLADARQALLPMLLHPAPRQALFLGLGTGITAASAAADPSLQVDAVELLPEVIAASAHFKHALPNGENGQPLILQAADARRFVKTAVKRYDVIVADNFHPARSGSGALYTVEHFAAIRNRLAPQGLFCQWLPLHQLDLPTLRSIVQSFVAVYPEALAMLATNSLETPVLGLVARADGGTMALSALRQRLAQARWPQPLADYGIHDELALLGGVVAGPQALARFAGSAALNTDDHPVVAYRAPRVTYAPDSLPRDRLMALLAELHVDPAEVMNGPTHGLEHQRLAAYWAARNRFIEAGLHVRPVADPQRMLAQVRGPLLEVLRTSADFRPAYDPLLRLAKALARTDPGQARSLLAELVALQPARPEAAQALEQLGRLQTVTVLP